MTLVAAWIRCTPGGEELVVSCDSRLTGGIHLDHAPKLFQLERQDAVLAYCGPTLVAYPILLQIKSSLDAHDETRSRVVDIVHLKSHIEKTIERLRSPISDLPSGDNSNRSFKFLLAGYSWKTNAFRAWVFRYDIKSGEFNAFSMRRSRLYRWVFMSDEEENERQANSQMMRHIQSNGDPRTQRLDWEPLKVLLNVIEDRNVPDIGGPPQIVKVYKHANTLPINVLWPETRKAHGFLTRVFRITHLGRPLLGYEKTRYLTLDPQTWQFIEPWKIRDRLNHYNYLEEAQLQSKLRHIVFCMAAHYCETAKLKERLTAMVVRKCTFDEMAAVMRDFRAHLGVRNFAPRLIC